MQTVLPNSPWLLEICPASTLKQLGLPAQGYKSRSEEGRRNRSLILDGIAAEGLLSISSPDVRAQVLDDHHGDALDSVIAAYATFRAIRNPAFSALEVSPPYALEGYVYV
jgi:hypothetical protein